MDIDQHLGELVRHVQDSPNSAEGAAVATAAGKVLQRVIPQVAQLRSAFVRALWAEGWTLDEIGEICDTSRQRIEQIVKR